MWKAGIVAALAVSMPIAVQSQGLCAPVDTAIEGMAAAGSFPVFGGFTGQSVVQVWVNPEKDVWVIVEILPNGLACVATGGDMPEVYEKPQGATF